MGNFSDERKTCTSKNSLQKLSKKKPTNTNALKLKTAQYQLAGIGTDRIHSKSDR